MGDFLLAFIILDLIMMIGNVVRYSGKGFMVVIPMIPLFLPAVLIYTLPLSGLIATVTTVSKIRKKKETVTLASSGVSIVQILSPFILIGITLSALTASCFQWFQPLADSAKQDYLANIGATILESEFSKKKSVVELGGITIYSFINDTKERSVIVQVRKNGTITQEAYAKNAFLKVNREKKAIDIKSDSVTAMNFNKNSSTNVKELLTISKLVERSIPYNEQYRKKGSYRHINLTNMWEDINDKTKPFDVKMASYFYEKISILMSPLLLVLAAFPLSFIGSADGKTPSFLFALGMVFLCYYPLLIFGKDLSVKDTFLPIWLCLQFPNIFLICFAGFGMKRLNFKV